MDRSCLPCGLVADGSGGALADCASAGCNTRHSRFSSHGGTSRRSGYWNRAEDGSADPYSASGVSKDCAAASEQAFGLSARRDLCNTGCAVGTGACHSGHSACRGYSSRSSPPLSSGGTALA